MEERGRFLFTNNKALFSFAKEKGWG